MVVVGEVRVDGSERRLTTHGILQGVSEVQIAFAGNVEVLDVVEVDATRAVVGDLHYGVVSDLLVHGGRPELRLGCADVLIDVAQAGRRKGYRSGA